MDLSSSDTNYIDKRGNYPLVKENDCGIRPAGKPDECFYCKSKVGQPHKHNCVCVSKKVKLKATIEYIKEVPICWDKERIEFQFNGGTWCADNLIEDINNYIKKTGDCLCMHTKIEVIGE